MTILLGFGTSPALRYGARAREEIMTSAGAWLEFVLKRILVAVLFCAQMNELSMLAIAILPFLMERIAFPKERENDRPEGRQK